MPSIRIRITDTDRTSGYLEGHASFSAAAKHRLSALLDCGVLPDPRVFPVDSVSVTTTLWLSVQQQAQLLAYANRHGIDGEGDAASALLHSAAVEWIAQQRSPSHIAVAEAAASGQETALDLANACLGQSTRATQARFYSEIEAFCANEEPRTVLFAEASTGVGKTRAFIVAAHEHLKRSPETNVVLAFPSFAILRQAAHEWIRLQESCGGPGYRIIAGQREFVSVTALEAILALPDEEDGETRNLARSWVKAGGPPPPGETVFSAAWMMSGLQAATHEAWAHLDDVRLDQRENDEDLGYLAYKGQWLPNAMEANAGVGIFCSHAMLATEVRLQIKVHAENLKKNLGDTHIADFFKEWISRDKSDRASPFHEVSNDLYAEHGDEEASRLGRIGLLIVDEAHQLEDAFAGVFATPYSIWRIHEEMTALKRLHPRSVPNSSIELIKQVWDRLRKEGHRRDGDPVSLSDAGGDVVSLALNDIQTALSPLSKLSKKAATSASARTLLRLKRAVELAMEYAGQKHSGMTAEIDFSPSARWPRLVVGRISIDRELDFLWSVISEKTVLVSATLYDEIPQVTLDSMRRILAVRDTRAKTMAPVRADWIQKPVTLMLAGDTHYADGYPRFSRPDRADEVATQRWRDELTKYILDAHQLAEGGSLVLMTAYEDLRVISANLKVKLDERVIEQSPDQPLAVCKARYLEMAKQGQRPIMLATGAAWTGLDLSLPGDPATDNVLTDLFIPVAPIGLKNTLTHKERERTWGFYARIHATQQMMKQAVGRLVRVEGLPSNRKLHFLDARMHSTDKKWTGLFAAVKRVLAPYEKRMNV